MGENGVIFEADGGDGADLLEVGQQLPGGGGPVVRRQEVLKEQIRVGGGVAAVVQRPAGAGQVPQVPVGGEPDLAVVEVKLPRRQGGQIVLPGQLAHGDVPVQQGEVLRDELSAGQPEAVLLVDQQHQLPRLSGVLPRRPEGGQGLVPVVLPHQVRRVQGGERGDREGGRQGQPRLLGADQGVPGDALAESGAQGGAGKEGALAGVEADELENRGGPGGGLELPGDRGEVVGGVHRQQLDPLGGKEILGGVPVLGVDQGDNGHRHGPPLPPALVGDQGAAVLGEAVRPCPHGGGEGLRAALHDGDVQQGRKAPVGGGEGDAHPAGPVGGHGGHAPQAVGVPL